MVLHLQGIDFQIIDTKGAENLAADPSVQIWKSRMKTFIDQACVQRQMKHLSSRSLPQWTQPGDIWCKPHTKRSLTRFLLATIYKDDPRVLSRTVTRPTSRKTLHNAIDVQNSSKFCEIFEHVGIDFLWHHSRLHEGTSNFTRGSRTILSKGLKRSAPTNDSPKFAKVMQKVWSLLTESTPPLITHKHKLPMNGEDSQFVHSSEFHIFSFNWEFR
ncbi:hypothetical protein Tco_1105555 [Tanacetum coccineum]